MLTKHVNFAYGLDAFTAWQGSSRSIGRGVALKAQMAKVLSNHSPLLIRGRCTGTTLVAGRPQVLFEFAIVVASGRRPYDIAPDGRFIIIRSGQADAGVGTAPQIVVVQNWFEELKRLVPTK